MITEMIADMNEHGIAVLIMRGPDILSFRERTVVLILLLVARMFTDDPAMSGEIKA